MKKIFKTVIYILLVLIIGALAFFFWAKSPNLDSSEYAKITKFNGNESSKAVEDSVLSVITYNIGYLSGMTNNTSVRPAEEFYTNNLKSIISGLKKHPVDVLAIQEIDFGGKRSYYVNQFEEMGEQLGYYNGCRSINWDKKYVPFPYFPPSVHFGKMLSGQAMMTNFEITDYERVVLSRVQSHPYYYAAMYLDRLVERVKIKVGDQEVMVFNAHTEAFDQDTRTKQMFFLKDWFLKTAETMPVILLGDFNSDPSYENAAILEMYNDERIGAMCSKENLLGEKTLTYPTDKPIEQLDFVFYSSRHFELLDWKVLYDLGEVSDHYPVLANLKLKKSEE
ncbi:endonuclease/exonuclease/phosphatase family protein [Flammeovirga yaeyamensis]|uniref:Endonuclease/exonuclease/phosphatase family protein n=1 Tax=Flammeovirga yaeyamensis TaxID=367791 RepID=A0AAX1NBY2_9BACT|nr:endonuclease/exonuclease/phosphatase family protein [Flammeovirga yaeyamensis]MBB3699015.1 endonuclease/exonuclease/phosphatase family metal-dependent hydrolase [Flammeovirga yaeyamensis]NMF36449.1 metal-dependent hydrolase [Flammeovirga yaeyamensis]QWG03592.1 endonuclease/exonuclease/phosphatase family protein [Flammeovirga yaeyamensis]